MTSRKERDIEDVFTKFTDSISMIHLQSSHVDPDIRVYINARLLGDRKLEKWQKDNEIKAEVENVLTQKAHGTYVHLTRLGVHN